MVIFERYPQFSVVEAWWRLSYRAGIFGIFGLGRIDEIEDGRQTGRLSFDSLLMVQTSDGDGDGEGDGMDE